MCKYKCAYGYQNNKRIRLHHSRARKTHAESFYVVWNHEGFQNTKVFRTADLALEYIRSVSEEHYPGENFFLEKNIFSA